MTYWNMREKCGGRSFYFGSYRRRFSIMTGANASPGGPETPPEKHVTTWDKISSHLEGYDLKGILELRTRSTVTLEDLSTIRDFSSVVFKNCAWDTEGLDLSECPPSELALLLKKIIYSDSSEHFVSTLVDLGWSAAEIAALTLLIGEVTQKVTRYVDAAALLMRSTGIDINPEGEELSSAEPVEGESGAPETEEEPEGLASDDILALIESYDKEFREKSEAEAPPTELESKVKRPTYDPASGISDPLLAEVLRAKAERDAIKERSLKAPGAKPKDFELAPIPNDEQRLRNYLGTGNRFAEYFKGKEKRNTADFLFAMWRTATERIKLARNFVMVKATSFGILGEGRVNGKARDGLLRGAKVAFPLWLFANGTEQVVAARSVAFTENATKEGVDFLKMTMAQTILDTATSQRWDGVIDLQELETPGDKKWIQRISSYTTEQFPNPFLNRGWPEAAFWMDVHSKLISTAEYKWVTDLIDLSLRAQSGEDIEGLPFDIPDMQRRLTLQEVFSAYQGAQNEPQKIRSERTARTGRFSNLSAAEAEDLESKLISEAKSLETKLWRENPELRIGRSINETVCSLEGKTALVKDLDRIRAERRTAGLGTNIQRGKLISKSPLFREYRNYVLGAYDAVEAQQRAKLSVKLSGEALEAKVLEWKRDFDVSVLASKWKPRNA